MTRLTNGLLATTLMLAPAPAAGQEIIELRGEDRWLDADFEEVFRIGSLDGEDWEQFGNVRKVAFDGSGQLYVFDSQADRIHVVAPDGEFPTRLRPTGRGAGRVPQRGGARRLSRRQVSDRRSRSPCIPDLRRQRGLRAHGANGVRRKHRDRDGSQAGSRWRVGVLGGGGPDALDVVFRGSWLGADHTAYVPAS